ncbi:hypothetical protein CALCODRAFT_372534 [Calocera cornea HHB12733]|uniref:Uncharacterized protein n=1 Tax=Calocera cornea HHB12733 TaxID=1353952 RepID=A0A165EGY8_9BASI|nr:hypothetical protein CALCODRAFT_372534 [Calocera cornea HHB12733]
MPPIFQNASASPRDDPSRSGPGPAPTSWTGRPTVVNIWKTKEESTPRFEFKEIGEWDLPSWITKSHGLQKNILWTMRLVVCSRQTPNSPIASLPFPDKTLDFISEILDLPTYVRQAAADPFDLFVALGDDDDSPSDEGMMQIILRLMHLDGDSCCLGLFHSPKTGTTNAVLLGLQPDDSLNGVQKLVTQLQAYSSSAWHPMLLTEAPT